MSASSKGQEREAFISLFLGEILPSIYRFGSGDIIDSINNSDASRRSGQLDIVIEMPWAPSLPMLVGGRTRLYPAESVGAAIEVKSHLTTQWDEVVRTANALEPLRQRLGGISVDGGGLNIEGSSIERVLLYAVGYDGWSTISTVSQKAASEALDGILVLKHQLFARTDRLAFFRRLDYVNDRLADVRAARPAHNSEASVACARMLELSGKGLAQDAIAVELNNERLESTRTHFGDQRWTPVVMAGNWTPADVDQLQKSVEMQTQAWSGMDALFQFIVAIHGEVSKRAAMSGTFSSYGT